MLKKNIDFWLDELYSFTDFAKRRKAKYNSKNYQIAGLTRLLKKFNDPHKKLKIFHIAGTKGKGSTAFYLANCLQLRKLKVGLYTSPQIIDERDRFQINNKKISWSDLINHLSILIPFIKEKKLPMTVFDILTAVSFLYFREKKVDFAIIETGLGGRLDSTNVVQPLGVIITKIGLDHTDKLGKTIKSIAKEKAGIIKTKIPTFTGEQLTSAMSVIQMAAKKVNSPLKQIKKTYSLPNLPFFQKENIALAFGCFDFFFKPLSSTEKKKVAQKQLTGRFELRENCLFDGAHNQVAFKALVDSVQQYSPLKFKKIELIFYCLPDKDYRRILKTIPMSWKITFFPLKLSFLPGEPHPILKEKKRYPRVIFLKSKDVFKMKSSKDILYIVAGSFYLIEYFWKKRRAGDILVP